MSYLALPPSSSSSASSSSSSSSAVASGGRGDPEDSGRSVLGRTGASSLSAVASGGRGGPDDRDRSVLGRTGGVSSTGGRGGGRGRGRGRESRGGVSGRGDSESRRGRGGGGSGVPNSSESGPMDHDFSAPASFSGKLADSVVYDWCFSEDSGRITQTGQIPSEFSISVSVLEDLRVYVGQALGDSYLTHLTKTNIEKRYREKYRVRHAEVGDISDERRLKKQKRERSAQERSLKQVCLTYNDAIITV